MLIGVIYFAAVNFSSYAVTAIDKAAGPRKYQG
jgi:hypothetical protein